MKFYGLIVLIVSLVNASDFFRPNSMRLFSYFPEASLVVERGLPFAVIGPDHVFIKQVSIVGGSSCRQLKDPYYPKVFHISCSKPSVVDLKVLIGNPLGADTEMILSGLQIRDLGEASPSAVLRTKMRGNE